VILAIDSDLGSEFFVIEKAVHKSVINLSSFRWGNQRESHQANGETSGIVPKDVLKTIEILLFHMFTWSSSEQYRKISNLESRFNQALTKSANTGFGIIAGRIFCEHVWQYA
jgi:hypothetical protein